MNEPKPVASLSGSLLARKGAARPAMRPQVQRLAQEENAQARHLEDLGWNDMGDTPHNSRPADVLPLTPVPVSPEAKAEAKAEDLAAATQLAENAKELAHGTEVAPPEVVRQQAMIAEKLALVPPPAAQPAPSVKEAGSRQQPTQDQATAPSQTPAAPKSKRRSSALAEGRRAAFTLRLDAERHLKLRLASAIGGSSAQQLVTKALDHLLETMPELETLAKHARPGRKSAGK